MGQQVTAETTVAASPVAVYDVITDVARYPEWSRDVLAAEVLQVDDAGRPTLASFTVDAHVSTVEYTLAYQHRAPDRVRWRLVEGELLRTLDGQYALVGQGDDRTVVRYRLEAELALPLPRFVQRRAARTILETGLEGLRRRVEAVAV